jgi:signal transduction histidine kinase
VRVNITDDGCGIDPDDLQKIFEPFFTTKPVGEGTGLGLWVSYGIVKSFRGDITVHSTPGEGTSFCVVLPLNAKGYMNV